MGRVTPLDIGVALISYRNEMEIMVLGIQREGEYAVYIL
jgi:hypothetical protein